MQAPRKRTAPKKPLTIFVADDNPDAVLMLAALLRDEGHVVETCSDARVALGVILRMAPEVCILDIKMPVKSGYDLAREIRAAKLARQPLLIAVSGHYKKPSEQLVARAAGFNHFIAKGTAEPGELLAILEAFGAPEDGEPPVAA